MLGFFVLFFEIPLGETNYKLLLKARAHCQCEFLLGFFFQINNFFSSTFCFNNEFIYNITLCSADRARLANKDYTCTWPRFQLVTLGKLDLFHILSLFEKRMYGN